MALRSVTDHPKFLALKSLLGCGKGEALGYLEALWHFTGKYAPQGNVGKYTDEQIESWIEWRGEPGKLVQTFTDTGWIDIDSVYRLSVHHWRDHADQTTKKQIGRLQLQFIEPDGKYPDKVRTEIGQRLILSGPPVPVPVPVPEPEPEPADLCEAQDQTQKTNTPPLPVDPPRAEVCSPPHVNSKLRTFYGRSKRWLELVTIWQGPELTDGDEEIYLAKISSAQLEATIFENLPLWEASANWQKGMRHSFKNFVREGIYKTRPKARADPPPAAGSIHAQVAKRMEKLRLEGRL